MEEKEKNKYSLSDDFKLVTSINFMERELFNSIMNYCQVKVDNQDLIEDVLCIDEDRIDDPVVFTKEIFDTRNEPESFSLYIPFSDEELNVIPRIKRFDKIAKKKVCVPKTMHFNCIYEIVAPKDLNYNGLIYEMFIYKCKVYVTLPDILLNTKDNILFFHIWFMAYK